MLFSSGLFVGIVVSPSVLRVDYNDYKNYKISYNSSREEIKTHAYTGTRLIFFSFTSSKEKDCSHCSQNSKTRLNTGFSLTTNSEILCSRFVVVVVKGHFSALLPSISFKSARNFVVFVADLPFVVTPAVSAVVCSHFSGW